MQTFKVACECTLVFVFNLIKHQEISKLIISKKNLLSQIPLTIHQLHHNIQNKLFENIEILEKVKFQSNQLNYKENLVREN